MSRTNAEFTYRAGAELPALTLPWTDQDGNPIDFTSGWTFELTLATTTATSSVLTKTSGISGYDGGVTIAWSDGELALPADTYLLWLRARRTADNFDRDYPAPPLFIEITDGPPPAPTP